MIRYDLPETAIGRVHLQSLLDKIEPTFDVTSWEAQYCMEKGIPLLCDEARRNKLIQRPDFPNKALFMIKGAAAQGTTGYMAMEYADGVLLFSNSANGNENVKAFRQYMTDHYFNPQFHCFYLHGYAGTRLPDPKLESKVDLFKTFYPKSNPNGHLSMPQVPAELLCDRSVLREMVRYSTSDSNMKPTFTEFCTIGKDMNISSANADIAYWYFIKEEGFPPVEYMHIAKSKEGLGHARRLIEEMSNCNEIKTANEIRNRNMEEARKILAERYPSIRGVADRQKKSQSPSKPKLKP